MDLYWTILIFKSNLSYNLYYVKYNKLKHIDIKITG